MRRYRALADTVGEGIFELDADGHVVAVNDVLVELTGYTRDEVLGEPLSLIFADDADVHLEDLTGAVLALETEDVDTLECTVSRASDDPISCELRLTPVLADGTFEGAVGVDRSDRPASRLVGHSGSL